MKKLFMTAQICRDIFLQMNRNAILQSTDAHLSWQNPFALLEAVVGLARVIT